MSLTFNNSKDIACDKLFLLDTNDILQDVLDLIANGGGGGGGGSGGITTLTGSGAAIISGTSTSKNILVDLSLYSTTTQINNMHFDKIPLIYSASINDLRQGVTGELLWDNQEVQLKINTFHQINAVLPIVISGANIVTIESLWKPSSVTAGAGLWGVASDTLGTLSLGVHFSSYSTTTQMNTALALKADDVAVAGGFASVNFELSTKQDRLNGVSRSPTYISGPAHFITPVSSAYNWVNAGTHSVFTSQGASYDMFQGVTLIVGKAYTLQCDVKLVGSSSVFVLGIEQTGNNAAQTFTAADGLNTSTYTTVTFSKTATQPGGYWNLGYMTWHTGSQPTLNDVYHLQNVSFSADLGVSVTGDLTITGTMTAATKSFDIKHPDPDKPDYRLRHWCIESDKPGGMVMYTKQIKATDYF